MQVVVFTDGGARGNPGPAGIGGVVVDAQNVLLFEFSKYIGVGTNNEAEYKALITALTWLNEQQQTTAISQITCKLDSLLVVNQVNKVWKIKEARLQTLAMECWKLLQSISVPHSIQHVPRAENAQADALVNQALDAQQK